jgi:hypothetical protein
MTEYDVNVRLAGAPPPHYLVHIDEIVPKENGSYTLKGRVNFPSTTPSISARMAAPTPHVNVGDAAFAVWNTVHALRTEMKIRDTLVRRVSFESYHPLPADREVNIETTLIVKKKIRNRILGEFSSIFKINSKPYLQVNGKGSSALID